RQIAESCVSVIVVTWLRCPRRLRRLLRRLAAGVGQLVDAAPVGLVAAHEALVAELLQRRIDRAGARLPATLAALGDLADDLVAVLGLLAQQGQDRRAHVAAA